MTTTDLLVLLAVGVVLSFALTGAVRRYALRAGMLDRPNERSSHTIPTPRGGGLAIVGSYLALSGVMAAWAPSNLRLVAALLGAGGLVALLGFIDDRRPLAARWRFGSHLVAAAWVVACLGPVPPAPLFGPVVDLGWAAIFVTALHIVWSVNQFNFMDGIDGIASVEAILVSLGGGFVWWLIEPHGAWPVAVLLAACVSGFLAWNFPPAKIFMGDVGSGFIGCVIAVLALASSHAAPHLFWSWLILVGIFMVDATVTLVRRALRGERVSEAHRSHAYQHAARRWRSHSRVTLACGAITALWLFPLAVAAAMRRIDGAVALVVAYAPLFWLAMRYDAGKREAKGA